MPGGGGGGLQLSCHGNDIAMAAGETFVALPRGATVSASLAWYTAKSAAKAVAIFEGDSAAPAARTNTFWRAGPILLEREAALFISPRTRAELASYKMPDGSLDVASAPAMAASMSAARRASLIKLFHSIDLDGNGCNARNCRAITAQLWCNSLTRLHTSLQRDRPQ